MAASVALALALLCVASGEARARQLVLVGPLGPLGIETREAMRVRRWLIAALGAVPGQRVRGSRRVLRAVQRRGIDCSAQPECLGIVARKLRGQLIVAGDVGSVGSGYVLYLRLVDAHGKQVRTISGVVKSGRGARSQMRSLSYRLLAPKHYTGTLRVEVDVKGAYVYVDGERRAQVAKKNEPLRIELVAGAHALRVTHDRHRDFVRFVRVGFQKTRRVKVALSELAVQSTEMRLRSGVRVLRSDELPWYRRWWAVATAGVIVAAATTVIVALIPRAVSRDAEVQLGRR
ncbi:MAG: PEGA domain-containing protein [Myxococcales bacterium]|nr:PEGA domain-containing protein [Myxococcales bacterium]